VLTLIRALADAHTPASIAQALVGAMPGLLQLKLTVGGTAWTLGPKETLKSAPAAAVESPADLLPAHSRRPEAIAARQAGAARLWTFCPTPGSSLALALASRSTTSDATLVALVSLALRHVEVVARVAELSRRAQRDTTQLQQALAEVTLPPGLVAAGPAMRAVLFDLVPLVARQPTTVLLRGETGTGKEVIARRIHAASNRANRPFLKVNCGALPEQLVESALFGHERGAFTGANSRHLGLFERADGGTLLLDEVAELPLAAQVKLLRVLQDGDFERVGGERTLHVDVRILAATHRPLEQLVAREAFRADLFYRLNVFPITLPPLRERAEELAPLTHAIVARLSQRLNRPAPQLSTAGLKRLQHHAWPGNIRELENVLERALLLSPGDTLVIPPLDAATAPTPRLATAERLDDALRDAIQAALDACDGKVFGPNGAAQRLGLKPTTLQSKLKKLGLSSSRAQSSSPRRTS